MNQLSFAKILPLPQLIREDRAGWGIRLVLASLFFTKLFTLGLWQSDRAFPHAPVFAWLPAIPAPLDSLLLLAELGLIGLLLHRPSRKRLLSALFCILVLWVLTDQIRLQPWYYLYALLLLPALFYKRPSSASDNDGVLLLMQAVIVGLYVWSGIHKHSYDYYHYVHGFIAAPLEVYLPTALFGLVEKSAYAAPWFELAVGLLLLFERTRNAAVLLIAAMHAYLLLCLGPLGNNWNKVIWPWNVTMVLLVWLLFAHSKAVPWKRLFETPVRIVALPVLLLAWFLPALRFADCWDNNLSFCLYSGKTKGLNFFVRANATKKLPTAGRQHLKAVEGRPDLRYMSADTWCMDELGVPVYPQERVYKLVGKALCETYFEGDELIVLIKRRPRYVEEGDLYHCKDL